MSKFCLAEIATLVIGWGSGLLFLLYFDGVFSGGESTDLRECRVPAKCRDPRFPYMLTFLCCWLLRRFARPFLLLSLLLTIGSTCVYYGFFVARRPLDDGWIFLMVPLAQTIVAASFSFVLLGIAFKNRPNVADQTAA